MASHQRWVGQNTLPSPEKPKLLHAFGHAGRHTRQTTMQSEDSPSNQVAASPCHDVEQEQANPNLNLAETLNMAKPAAGSPRTCGVRRQEYLRKVLIERFLEANLCLQADRGKADPWPHNAFQHKRHSRKNF